MEGDMPTIQEPAISPFFAQVPATDPFELKKLVA
jgi:hypothetical protein